MHKLKRVSAEEVIKRLERLAIGTLKGILRQAKVDIEEFLKL
ncbi:hypothetical protein [Thermodesulfovibrio thiophilus]|nr:hypothetical protein [Thermodesulfovibrio thiophilus]